MRLVKVGVFVSVFVIFFYLPGIAADSTGTIKARHGTHILPNGKFAKDEWADASKAQLKNGVALLAKQDSVYLYLGIQFLDTMHTGIDLYLAESAEKVKMLHVSAALGEKDLVEGVWSDYLWGKNDLWVANSIGTIRVGDQKEVVPLEGFEFQINKSMFQKKQLSLMIRLKRPALVCPPDANAKSIENWLVIEL